MKASRVIPLAGTGALIVGALAIAALVAQAPQGADVRQKLTTILSDLAEVVPQQSSDDVTPLPAMLDVNRVPASVRDAMDLRRLRIDPAQRAQVYILRREALRPVLEWTARHRST